MLVKGLLTSLSGSLGGVTASHNTGGLYLRARRVPVNPNTSRQAVVRNAVRDLTTRWSSVLTDAQRAGWEEYALNVPLLGPLGDPRHVSGEAMYVRSNVSRLQANAIGVNIVDDAPVVFDLGDFTAPTIAISGSNLVVSFNNADDWANEDGGALLVYMGLPQNPGRSFFNGPWRFAGPILGDSTTPPTSPSTLAPPFSVAAGDGTRVFVYFRATRADGRLSGRSQLSTVA